MSMVVAALAGTLLVAYLLWTVRQEAIQTAQTAALNYARTLEVRLDATLRRTDAVLSAIAATVPSDALAPGGEDRHGQAISADLAAMLRHFGELLALRVIDAAGDQRYVALGEGSPPLPAQSVNYADRDYFQHHRRQPDDAIRFSEVITGRLSGRMTLVVTRAIRTPAGEFAGAVLAPLDLDVFQAQFRKLDIGRNGAVFLRRADDQGRLVLRWPQIDAEVNRQMPADQVIWRAVASGQRESLNEYVAFTDGVHRLSGTVRVQGYPFFLTVALSQDDVLAGWNRLAAATALIWIALLAAFAVLLRRLQLVDRARLSLERQLLESRRIESLGTLAGGIAHDFNNILAAIIGNVALARRGLAPDDPAQDSLEQVRKASARGRELVQQILAIGRQQPQALVGQALQPLVEEAAALLRPTLPPGLQITLRMGDAAVHARVDATQLEQVLLNLCANACHAMRGRSGRIEVGLQALPASGRAPRSGIEAPAGAWAHLWVSDEGAGMDAATRARIFEPFFTTKPAGEGTGLGLPVVQGVVAGHGGEIRIDSAPGRGTTVHMYLPLCAPEEAIETPTPGSAAAPAAPLMDGAGRRVLYVDDDEVVALMVERLLQQAGYRATVLNHGAEALARVASDPQGWDAVVTDYNMPGMSGLDVVRGLASLRPDLPVIISSGYITEELTQAADAAGVRGLLQKQNTLEELTPLLAAVLAAPPARPT